MTRLELAQELVMLTGIAGSGPTTTISQAGGMGKAVKYIDMAHEEVQSMYTDWDFLWSSNTITTVAAQATYDGESDLGVWDTNTGIMYDNAPLTVIDWKDYRPSAAVTGEPEAVVIQPDNKLLVLPTPSAAYTISYNYYKAPTVLTLDSSEPLIPARFQRVIIGRALMLYGNFELAEEIKLQGQEIYQQYLQALKDNQLIRRRQTAGFYEGQDITVVPV